jgi:hypothetical protein
MRHCQQDAPDLESGGLADNHGTNFIRIHYTKTLSIFQLFRTNIDQGGKFFGIISQKKIFPPKSSNLQIHLKKC